MCTVVCRWDPDHAFPVQLLALRDERRRRDFDRPGAWWPQAPGVIGGRDHQAGGSWCVCDPATGATAVVLNRPDRLVAETGAPSRGQLPLLAITHGQRWCEYVDVDGMAGFNLVLIEAGALHWWSFDGEQLQQFELGAGTHLFKPSGLSADLDTALLTGQAQLDDIGAPVDVVWSDWLALLRAAQPTPDQSGLLTRRPLDNGDVYETVFGQFIAGAPGLLRLDYQVEPATGGPWTTVIRRPGPRRPDSPE